MQNKVLDFIKEKQWEYKKGNKNNIGIKICPFCGGKNKEGKVTVDNLNSFYIDLDTGLYQCFRGSCGARGHINTLAKKKIFESEYKTTKSDFKETEFLKEVKALGSFDFPESNKQTLEYLEKIKISPETLKKAGCRILKKSGDIIVPCYENGILVNYKRRYNKPSTLSNGRELKTKNSSSGKSTLYGMQLCFNREKPLVIVEGEIDMLTLIECGVENAVSVPNGAGSFNFIENCFEFLDGFKEIIIWFDNDNAGKKGFEKIRLELKDYNLYRIESIENDANDVLKYKGKERVKEYIKNKKRVHVDGIIFSNNVDRKKIRNLKRVSSGVYGIDYYLRGFRGGELTIWSGKNSSGKTTLLGQLMLNLIEQGEKIFAYSGELSVEMFKEWLFIQACQESRLEKYKDELSKTIEFEVSDLDFKRIDSWIGENLIIYNKSDIAKEEELLEAMKNVYHKYGCRNFFLDNLMMMSFEEASEKSIYLKQSQFTKKVKGFVTNNNSHCHLVVHPYKTDKKFITKDDIGGSGDIVNSADNVLIMHNQSKMEDQPHPARLDVEKNRVGGKIGEIYLGFEYSNKRFYTPSDTMEKNKKYSWELIEEKSVEQLLGDAIPDDLPELFKEF